MKAITNIEATPSLEISVMSRRLSAAPLWAAAIVSFLTFLILVGWAFEIDFLKRIIPGYVVMNPTTAVTFILSSAALWLLQSADARRIRIAQIFAAVVATIGLIKLCAVIGFFDIGIDRIFFANRLFDDVIGQPNRMNPNTALNFLLFGAALLLLNVKTKSCEFFPAQYPVIAVLLTSFLTLIDYFYDANSTKVFISVEPMTIYAAVSFSLLAVGLLLSRPERGIIMEIFSADTGGEMARRLFPLIIMIPAFLGWLELNGEKYGFYKIEIGNAILVATIITVIGTIILNNARLMNIGSSKRRQTEELMRQSEEKYRNILASIEEGYFEIDLKGNFTFFNDALCSILGYDQCEVREMNYRQQVDSVNKKKLLAAMVKILNTGQPASQVDWEIARKDNTRRFVESSISLIRNTAEEPIGFRGLIRDVTGRKYAEETLRARDLHFRSILENSSDAIALFGADGAILYSSPSTPQVLGFTPDEMIGLNAFDLIYADDHEMMAEQLALIATQPRISVNIEARVRHKDGSLRWLEGTFTNLLDEPNVGAIVNNYRDITERKKAEKELKESQQLLKTVIETLPLAIFWKDRERVYTGANGFFADTAGFDSPEQMIGLTDYDMSWTKEDSDFYREDDRRVMETGISELNVVESHLNPDGKRVWFDTNKVPLRNVNGEVVGILGTVADITEQRNAEEAVKNSRDYLNRIINAVADPIFVNDRQHRLVLANDAFCQIMGRTKEGLIGTSPENIFPPEQARIFIEVNNQVFESGKETSSEEQLTDGQGNVHFLITKKTVYEAPNGEQFIVGVINDITESIKTQEAVRQSEEKYRNILEEIQEGYFETDLNGKLTFFNDALCDALKYSRDELMGVDCTLYTDKENTAKIYEFFKQIYKTNQPGLVLSCEVIRKDGERRVHESTISLIRNAADAPTGFRGLARDITERMRVEENLRFSEMQLSEAQQIAHVGSWEWDIKADKTTWSDELYRIFGLEQHEFGATYETFLESIHPDDREMVSNIIQNALLEKDYPSFEYRIVRPDGELRTIHADGKVILDANGDPVKMLGTIMDITGRKQAEEILRESEERFRLLVEGVRDYAILMLDTEGRIVSWNKSAERIKGYQADEIIGQHFSCFYMGEDVLSGKPERELKVAEAKGKYEEEGWRVRKDGSLFWANVLITAVWDEAGNLRGFSKITRDITERKHIEEEILQSRDAALESVRLKSEFLANMSHEIRTPMNGVIGMTGLLLDTNLNEEQRDYAQTVQSSADALLRIIDDILDFSKIEAGQLHFEKIDFDLRECVEATVETLAERAQSKGIEIASLVYRDVPTPICGDPGRLRQILTNLIGNAIKFTEKGEVTVRVQKQSDTGRCISLRFEVTDTGIGISEQAQHQLFQAFVQADGSTTRKYGGTGLGLAISKQLVEMMGGEIGVESVLGKGSTFWFTACFQKQANQTPIIKTIGDASLENVRVLIVDDNETNRRIFLHQTSSWGMIAAEADSGRQALEMLRAAAEKNDPFEIAILDLMMPEMDGFELAHAIKSEPDLSGTHLVLLPSYGKRGDGQTARDFGIAAYIQKPVRQSQLYNCLMTVIAEASSSGGDQSPNLITQHSLRGVDLPGNGSETAVSKTRILVAEDNAVNRKVALSQLKSLGYTADFAMNGRETVDAAAKIQYDIILMDCQMPEMDGFEATAEIRRFEGDSTHTTIIAMTAHALEGERERCIAAGMDDYISKPVKLEMLKKMLKQWVVPTAPAQSADKSEMAKALANGENRQSVDLSVLDSFRDLQQPNEPNIITELIDLFLVDAGKRIKILRKAVDEQETAKIKEQAHGIKGSSGNIGALQIAVLSGTFEEKDLDSNQMKNLITEIEDEFQKVTRILTDTWQSGQFNGSAPEN